MTLRIHRGLFMLATLLLVAFGNALSAPAQDPQPTPLTAPPPRKLILKEERAQLDQEREIKDRLKLTISLAGNHLTRAEQLTAQSSYDDASAEVGMYHALIEDALDQLGALKRDANKTRDLYKRLELALRADGPRLTAMRRTTPLEFAVWIKKVEDFARDGRTEALNSFYGHTVVRDREPQKAEAEKPNEKPSPTPKSNQP
jgi:hypothetical protein